MGAPPPIFTPPTSIWRLEAIGSKGSGRFLAQLRAATRSARAVPRPAPAPVWSGASRMGQRRGTGGCRAQFVTGPLHPPPPIRRESNHVGYSTHSTSFIAHRDTAVGRRRWSGSGRGKRDLERRRGLDRRWG